MEGTHSDPSESWKNKQTNKTVNIIAKSWNLWVNVRKQKINLRVSKRKLFLLCFPNIHYMDQYMYILGKSIHQCLAYHCVRYFCTVKVDITNTCMSNCTIRYLNNMQKLILNNLWLHHLNAQSVVPSVEGIIYSTLLIILSSTAVAPVLLKWWWKMISCYEKQKIDFNVV